MARIAFPEGARQGAGQWYRIDLELEVDVQRDLAGKLPAGTVPAYLSLAVDGATVFQLKLSPVSATGSSCSSRSNSGLEWSTYGLVYGAQRGPVPCDDPFSVRFANYLQARSVHAGEVPVTLKFEGPDPRLVGSVVLRPGSKVVVSEEGPPRVEVRLGHASVTTDGGTTRARVDFSVTVDGKPVGGAKVDVSRITDSQGVGPATAAAWNGEGYEAGLAWDGSPEATLLVSAAVARGSTLAMVEVGAADGGPAGPAKAALLAEGIVMMLFALMIALWIGRRVACGRLAIRAEKSGNRRH